MAVLVPRPSARLRSRKAVAALNWSGMTTLGMVDMRYTSFLMNFCSRMIRNFHCLYFIPNSSVIETRDCLHGRRWGSLSSLEYGRGYAAVSIPVVLAIHAYARPGR